MNWNELAAVATAAGVFVAAYQLRLAARHARTAFEDALAREYREIARAIPMEAHVNTSVTDEEVDELLPHMFQYFDLSNQQAFLRLNGRIGRSTWCEWRDGIESNMVRPAFARCWERIQQNSPTTFQELRKLRDGMNGSDPRSWKSGLERFGDWWAN